MCGTEGPLTRTHDQRKVILLSEALGASAPRESLADGPSFSHDGVAARRQGATSPHGRGSPSTAGRDIPQSRAVATEAEASCTREQSDDSVGTASTESSPASPVVKTRWKLRNSKFTPTPQSPKVAPVAKKACPRLCNAKLVTRPASVLVVVHRLSGETAQIKVHLDISVGELKRRVADSWQIPPQCQKLILDSTVLEDCDKICHMTESHISGRDICVTMLATTIDLQMSLESVSKEKQVSALRCYARLAWKSNEDDIEAVIRFLGHEDNYVRIAAVDALVGMASKGSEQIIDAVIMVLNNHEADARARCAAIIALVHMCPRGHAMAVRSVLARLDDESVKVRSCVVDALPQLMTESDTTVLDIVAERLGHSAPPVRHDALLLASKVAWACPHRIVDAIAPSFDHSVDRVRTVAVQAMLALAANGVDRCVPLVVDLIGEATEHAQACAEMFVHRLAMQGDERVLTALRVRLAKLTQAGSEHTGTVVANLETAIHTLVDTNQAATISHVTLCHWADELMACMDLQEDSLVCAAAYGLGVVLKKLRQKFGGAGVCVEITFIAPVTLETQTCGDTGRENTIIKALCARLKDPHAPTVLGALMALISNKACRRSHVEGLAHHACPKIKRKAWELMEEMDAQQEGDAFRTQVVCMPPGMY